MGRGRSKEKVQQAFLQRKWLLGGYLTLWEKEKMRTIHCKGGWPPGTARGAVGTTIVDLVTLRHSPGDDFDSCGDREAIALRSRRGRSTTGPASRRCRSHGRAPSNPSAVLPGLVNQK
jgi:hypothetical protein